MSEYEPITAELRELLADVSWAEITDHMHLDHGGILDGDWLDSWHAAVGHACDAIDAVHAGLERENAELRERLAVLDNERGNMHDGWVRLPLDADGEYIHVGDVLDGYGKTIEVVEMRYGRSGWVLISSDGNGYADTFAFSHHHVPTVEDVLRKFADGLGVPVADSYIAASAAKLRLAGDAE